MKQARELALEVQFGEGGDDSKLFVQELFAAYARYAERQGLTCELLGTSPGQITARISGEHAWDCFRHEPGKHCVQRCPDTDRSGRRHTSIVTVAILPLLPEQVNHPLPEAELLIKTQGGSGPGGQHQNKTESAVRMTHIPTGLQVFINGRDQHRNRREALKILTGRVNELARDQLQAEYHQDRRSQRQGGGRGEKVRTYNFIEGRVVDHRLNTRTAQIKQVMKGEFELLWPDSE